MQGDLKRTDAGVAAARPTYFKGTTSLSGEVFVPGVEPGAYDVTINELKGRQLRSGMRRILVRNADRDVALAVQLARVSEP